jgi:hypothetical protein
MKRAKGAKQGGPGSMQMFSWAFDESIASRMAEWNVKQWGFDYGQGFLVNNVQQVDGYYAIVSIWLSFVCP